MAPFSPLGRILLVDDDRNITDLLKFNLTSEGFGIDVIPLAEEIDFNDIAAYRLIIVDAKNQMYTGFDLADDIKQNPRTSHVPIIICSEPDGEDDIINAFDHGADDYVAKPFSLREMIARIKAILRRHPIRDFKEQVQASRELTAPDINLSINTDTQKVMSDGAIIPLTKTEYAILLFLFKNRNSFFSRDAICQEVWKNEETGNVRIVDTNISRLRKKLGDVGKHIINRYSMGYAFVDKVV